MDELEKFIDYDPAGYTLREAIIEAKRCLHCAKPLCRTGCPIENEIPDFIAAMAQGNLGTASMIIAKRSNLPAVCGRVCPHERQCEAHCVLTKKKCGIEIGSLEMFIADLLTEIPATKLLSAVNNSSDKAIISEKAVNEPIAEINAAISATKSVNSKDANANLTAGMVLMNSTKTASNK